jgi:hypothetical protein
MKEESEQKSPIFNEQCDETPKKTERRQPKEATSYSVGDITELLDAIKEILPQNNRNILAKRKFNISSTMSYMKKY